MNRRDFLNTAAAFAAGSVLAPNAIAQAANAAAQNSAKTPRAIDATLTLSNGVKIPQVGLGLWRVPNEKVAAAVEAAIDSGYRHFDSAQAYGNEAALGAALKAIIQKGKVKRSEIFVTTKVRGELKDYDSVKKSMDESLAKIDLDYIDLMLIHCPQPWAEFRRANYDKENRAIWRAFEEYYAAGKFKAIGVSNFLQADLKNILDNCKVAPHANQILLHVGETPFSLVDYCKAQNVAVEAYSPIAHGNLLRDERLKEMAARYGVSVPQLCIRYTIELGVITLPKSANPAHVAENAQLDFVISEADMATLKALTFKDYGENANFPVFSGKNY